jgi:hypothetical protein
MAMMLVKVRTFWVGIFMMNHHIRHPFSQHQHSGKYTKCISKIKMLIHRVCAHIIISRKLCKKRFVVVFPLRFFWPACSVITKRLHVCFFSLPARMFRNLGACNITLQRSWKYLSSGILHTPKNCNCKMENKRKHRCKNIDIYFPLYFYFGHNSQMSEPIPMNW